MREHVPGLCPDPRLTYGVVVLLALLECRVPTLDLRQGEGFLGHIVEPVDLDDPTALRRRPLLELCSRSVCPELYLEGFDVLGPELVRPEELAFFLPGVLPPDGGQTAFTRLELGRQVQVDPVLLVDDVPDEVPVMGALADDHISPGLGIVETCGHGPVPPVQARLTLNVALDLDGVVRIIDHDDVATFARVCTPHGGADPVSLVVVLVPDLRVLVGGELVAVAPPGLIRRGLDEATALHAVPYGKVGGIG